jgi:hypothetical protein
MADSLTTNPIIIDTAASTVKTSYVFSAWMIRWVGGTTAGHTISVQDKNGNVKYATVASAANYVEESHLVSPKNESLIFDGLKVPTIGSGTIYIYTDSGTPIKT